ncbi:GntR family transcriptional regulator [Planococcus sp. YIM B11945]|uniref:GntR family transcriptional regulator n=1 Tax=Planococcus sp. YIM B11945 TaxID=3435410 RepID=UPI003D7CE820
MEIQIAEPLYHQVYKELRKLILSGKILPGEKVNASQLAKQYNISRTPLREAIQQLISEGLIIQFQGSLKVVELNKQDFVELYQCRRTLEKEVMRIVVQIISEEELNEIQSVLTQSEVALEENNTFKVLGLFTQFHDLLIRPCTNKRLLQLLDQIHSFLLIYRANITKNPVYNYEIHKEHLELFEALKSKDIANVNEVIEKHINNDLIRGLDRL